MLSELKGHHCPECGAQWRKTGDFERIHSYEAPYTTIAVTMTHATYWKVRCLICNRVSEIVMTAEED